MYTTNMDAKMPLSNVGMSSHDIVAEPYDSHVGVGFVHGIQNLAHGDRQVVFELRSAFLCRLASRSTCWHLTILEGT